MPFLDLYLSFWIFSLVRRRESEAVFGPLSREVVFSGGLDCAGLILDLLLVRWRGSDAGFGSSPPFLDLFLVRRREPDADLFFVSWSSGGPDCAGSDGGKREVRF